MGNVLASSGPSGRPSTAGTIAAPPPPPLPQQTMPPPQLGGPPIPPDAGSTQVSDSLDPNPGTMEDLHKKCKDIFPVNFDGAKIMVNKGLSNHFQISHTLNMSNVTASGYRFGATYVGTKQFSPSEAFPVLLGDIDPSGNLNANIIHQFNQSVRCKFAAQVQNSKFVASQLTTDYRGKDYTASFTIGNPDIINESGVIVTQYLQNVAPKLALGAELVYQYGSQVPGGEIAVVSLASRYTGSNYIVSGTLGGAGVHACYYHKASEQLQLGVEVDTNFRLQESVASIGYQIDLPKANMVFRGMLDSNWTVGAVLEKKLQPLPFTFALSGLLNHTKNQSRFGIGLIIG